MAESGTRGMTGSSSSGINPPHSTADVRHSLKQFEKDGKRKLTEERIGKLDALGFKWTH
jgi:hypothetical protein